MLMANYLFLEWSFYYLHNRNLYTLKINSFIEVKMDTNRSSSYQYLEWAPFDWITAAICLGSVMKRFLRYFGVMAFQTILATFLIFLLFDVVNGGRGSTWFFVACYATLHHPLSVRPSVRPSVFFWGFCGLWPQPPAPMIKLPQIQPLLTRTRLG